MHRSVAHHLELVAAVRAHDPDWAESVMRSHLFSARAALLGGRGDAAHAPHAPTHTGPPAPAEDLTEGETA
jgi:hypothetical protein